METECLFEPKYFSMDLLQEIWARLPVKALVRMRCVCKAWCSMIDSPYFACMHFKVYNESNCRIKNSNESLLCVGEPLVRLRYDPCRFTLRHNNSFKKIDELCEIMILYQQLFILGSCNGLWLIEQTSCKGVLQRRVWNPCTKKSLRLLSDRGRLPFVSYVMGFAPSHNDYKVVRLKHNCLDSKVEISVCSLSTNQWRTKTNTIEVPNFELSKNLCIQNVVFIKNASYWLELCPKTEELTYLVSFDFDAEELSFFKLPDAEEDTMVLAKFIFNLNDSIAVLSISCSITRVWTLDKKSDKAHQWKQWLSTSTHVNAIKLIEDPHSHLLHTSIFYQHNTGTFFITAMNGKLISYNISNHRVEYLKEKRFNGFFYTYVENLVSHKDPKWENCT